MKIDTAPSQVATDALQALPFSNIIGAPLEACIKAQAMAAQTTWKFIQEVGMQDSSETGEKEAVNVSFTFIQNGNTARLNIPLLSIVPIPYIAIQNIDIAFKANLSASSSAAEEHSSNSEFNAEASAGARIGWGIFSANLDLKGGYSSKKDSRATQDSKYSVEYTMDVGIRAGQESMPAGLAKVLEILNSSLTISDPKGTLGLNDNVFVIIENGEDKERAQVIATYRTPAGLYDPAAITISTENGGNVEGIISGNSKVFPITVAGDYVISAGKLSEKVTVKSVAK